MRWIPLIGIPDASFSIFSNSNALCCLHWIIQKGPSHRLSNFSCWPGFAALSLNFSTRSSHLRPWSEVFLSNHLLTTYWRLDMAIRAFSLFSCTSNNSANWTSMAPFYSTSKDLSNCSARISIEMGNSTSFVDTKSYDKVLRTCLGVMQSSQSIAQRFFYHSL